MRAWPTNARERVGRQRKGRPEPPHSTGVLALALGLVLGRALALGLRHVLGACGSILGHALLFLCNAFPLHGAAPVLPPPGLLAGPDQLAQDPHRLPLP